MPTSTPRNRLRVRIEDSSYSFIRSIHTLRLLGSVGGQCEIFSRRVHKSSVGSFSVFLRSVCFLLPSSSDLDYVVLLLFPALNQYLETLNLLLGKGIFNQL